MIKVFQRRFPTEEILALPEWIGQRDTERHANQYVAREDFDKTNPTIATGWAVVLVGKKEYRINGNTRSFCAKRGDIDLPKYVYGDYYECSTEDEAHHIYVSIDNTSSGKGAQDRLTSALKKCGIAAKSKMFKSGRGTTGLALSWNMLRGTKSNGAPVKTEGMILEFLPEIKIVDSLMALHNISSSHAIVTCPAFQMGMFMTLYQARHTPVKKGQQSSVDAVTDFWEKVIITEGDGNRENGYITKSAVCKMWVTVKEDLLKNSARHGRSRHTWFTIGEKVLYIFERRRAEIDRVGKIDMTEFFPCYRPDADADEQTA